MEFVNFEGVNLAELLPRIPDSVKDDLPFGLVKLDLTGKILEYNMAEGEMTGVKPDWALGKNSVYLNRRVSGTITPDTVFAVSLTNFVCSKRKPTNARKFSVAKEADAWPAHTSSFSA